MNTLSQISRVANFAILLLAVVTLSSCSKPPDDALRQGILASARTENPLLELCSTVTLKEYKVTNQYKQGDIYIYEYKGTLQIEAMVAGSDKMKSWDDKIQGKVGFQKLGNRWDFRPM